MKNSSPSKPSAAVLIASAAILFTLSNTAPAQDNLADRTVISASLPLTLTGTFSGKTREGGEINEAGGPAGNSDRSVWYEWTPPQDGALFLKLSVSGSFSTSPLRGVAAYKVGPAGGVVTMGNLVPAGAASVQGRDEERGVRLWAAAGEKIILKAWVGSSSSDSFTLGLSFTPVSERVAGDLPSTALSLTPQRYGPPGSSHAYLGQWTHLRYAEFTAEAEDLLIGGTRFPCGEACWYRWRATETGLMRFSLTGDITSGTTLLVAEQPSPGGPMNLVAGPATSLLFTPVPGKDYLFRVAFTVPAGDYNIFEFFTLQGARAQAGDEYTAPRRLTVGASLEFNLAGASPTRLPLSSGQRDNYYRDADLWFDLGDDLSGLFDFKADGNVHPVLYATDVTGKPVSSGWVSTELPFFAEPGKRYLARVMATVGNRQPWGRVSLSPHTVTPPANDRRQNPLFLPAEGPVIIFGNAEGATAEVSDWAGSFKPDAVRTVWYALDRPAGVQPWFVSVLSYGGADVSVFREEDGLLVESESEFPLTGNRMWFMVSVDHDTRFILLAGPAVAEGDDVSAAVPLTAGEEKFLYVGAATANSPLPVNLPVSQQPGTTTQWLSWTAEESGPVVVSTCGSSASQMSVAIFTADMNLVPTTAWVPSNYGGGDKIQSFQAVAGTSYRIALYGYLRDVARVMLKPGGWESPWDVWMQNYPAWRGEPSMTNPLADADGDGLSNLLEMGLGRDLLVVENYPDSPWAPTEDGRGLAFAFTEYIWRLRGTVGSRPFTLKLESSSDLKTWSAVAGTGEEEGPDYKNHSWEFRPVPGVDAQAKYFRLNVSR